jgi:predicted lipoprotein with Yx(FWY)xxD motif
MKLIRKSLVVAALALGVTAVALGASAASAVVKVQKTPALGRVIANAQGRTLYLFRADTKTKSACYGACATYWPPLITTGKPTAAAGAKAALLGTIKRKDGKLQVTYKGHPLYTFALDKAAGQTKGEGLNNFGAKWYALAPSGATIDRD